MLPLLLLLVLAQTTTPIAPPTIPCAGPEHRQFDFWIGDWDVRAEDGRLLGTNRITSILGGCALQEEWSSADGKVRGVSINAFDPSDHQWHQTWVDTGPSRLVLVGSLVEGRMVMEQRALAASAGRIDVQRVTWTPLDDGRVRQHWQASTDGGARWTTVFEGYYTRQAR